MGGRAESNTVMKVISRSTTTKIILFDQVEFRKIKKIEKNKMKKSQPRMMDRADYIRECRQRCLSERNERLPDWD